MYPTAYHFLTVFLYFLSLSSGSSVSDNSPLETMKHGSILYKQEKMVFSSSSVSVIAQDTTPSVPIVNPDQGTTPPLNPPTPPAPTSTEPTPPLNPPTPPTPTSTEPTTNPTTPTTNPTNPQNPNNSPSSSGGSWCIAKQDASPTALQVALDYACGYGGADCSQIQQGAACYEPNTVRDHASYAFNDYYHKHPGPNSCDFGGAAQLTNTDPSSGNCHYTSSSTSSSMTPLANPGTTPPTMPTAPEAPTTMTPTTVMPGGSTDYGEEPTGLPSSANSTPHCLLLLITICLLGTLVPVNYL